MVWHTIVIPAGDRIESFHMWDVDQPHLILCEALLLAGGDSPRLIRTIPVQDFLDSYDSATWYSVPVSRQNMLALIAAGYTPSENVVEAAREAMPSQDEVAAFKSLIDAFIKDSLEAMRIGTNDRFQHPEPETTAPTSASTKKQGSKRKWWRFWT